MRSNSKCKSFVSVPNYIVLPLLGYQGILNRGCWEQRMEPRNWWTWVWSSFPWSKSSGMLLRTWRAKASFLESNSHSYVFLLLKLWSCCRLSEKASCYTILRRTLWISEGAVEVSFLWISYDVSGYVNYLGLRIKEEKMRDLIMKNEKSNGMQNPSIVLEQLIFYFKRDNYFLLVKKNPKNS